MTEKQIHLRLGKYIYSAHEAWPSPTAWKKKCKDPPPSLHTFLRDVYRCMRHQNSERSSMSCDDLMFSLSFATNEKKEKKFPRGPWPLNVTHRVSFSLYILSVYYILCAQKGAPFVPELLNVESSRGTLSASQRKLLNRAMLVEYWIWQTAVFILTGAVMDFYWHFQVAYSNYSEQFEIGKQSKYEVCLILLDTVMAEAADEMICATLNSLYIRQLCAYTPITTITSIFSFLALLPSCPLSPSAILLPSYPFAAHVLPLHVYTPLPFHVLCLLSYLLTIQVNAAVWNHGAGVSGRKLTIHVCFHLQEGIHGGCEAGWQLILWFVSSLSVALLMPMLLLVFVCHLQIQWGIIQVRL